MVSLPPTSTSASEASASTLLKHVLEDHKNERITFMELKNALHERGFAMLLFVFSFPLALPIPLPPGFTTIGALPLLVFTVQMIAKQKSPWLPQWIGKKTIKYRTLSHIITQSVPYLKRAESYLKPRFFGISKNERLLGLICFIFACNVACPIPLSNLIPSIGIAVTSLGMLSRDGLIVLAGLIIGAIGLVVTSIICLIGADIIMVALASTL